LRTASSFLQSFNYCFLEFLWTSEAAETNIMKATERNTRTASSWNLLPEEVMLHLFSFLRTAEDLCSVSCVCKSFHLVSGDDALWMPLGSPGWDTSAKDVGWKQFYIEWVRKAVQIRRTASVSYEGYLSFAPLPPPKRLAWDEDPSLRQYDFIGKILVVGAASVGKSSFSNFFELDQAHRNQWRRKQVLRRIGDFNLQVPFLPPCGFRTPFKT